MKNVTIKAVVFSLMLVIVSACNAKNEATVDTQSTTDEPVMQAGGYSNINNAKLESLLNDNVLLVDIRREEEWQQTGIVEGSKTITFFDKTGQVKADFVPKFTQIANPDQPVILICRTGNRTRAASEALVKQLGYKNVMNVTNGITGWIAEKRPVAKY